jgi:sugar/nucleoside kinase (ribokinase family)
LVEDSFCSPIAALPAEGSLVALDDVYVRAGGCAANVAFSLAKQGVAVDVAGCVGADPAGACLISTYGEHQIGAEHVVRVAGQRTSKCIVILVDGEDRRYLYTPGANAAFTVDNLSRAWVSELDILYIGGLFVLPGLETEALAELLAFCRDRSVKTVVDVIVPFGMTGMSDLAPLLPLIDVFLPNEDEAAAFTGLADPFDQLRSFEAAGASTIIVTRGAHGSLASRDGKRWLCTAYPIDAVDPSGAGDAFTAGVICGTLNGWELPNTLRYASALGASATRQAGATDGVFSREEAEEFVGRQQLDLTELG